MWHLHMLSPVAYHRDCIRLFGSLLDDDGGFGKGEDEKAVLGACFEHTAARYEAAFGEAYAAHRESATNCWHDCAGCCSHACSSKAELN